MRGAVPVAIWHLPQIGLLIEDPVLQGSFRWLLRSFFCRFLVVHISSTRTGKLNSHHQQSPMQVEGIHTMGYCLVPKRDHLQYYYHHLSALQPLTPCVTTWLGWTRALFATLGHTSLCVEDAWGLIWRGGGCSNIGIHGVCLITSVCCAMDRLLVFQHILARCHLRLNTASRQN
jgi:hypothetical protein